MPFRALVILLAATLVLAGCTSSAPSGQATAAYQIALETQPSPMQSGRLSTVMLRVTDASGQPLRGANVSFKGQHKGMSHGGGTVVTQEREPGVYSAGFMPTMAGAHAVTVTVEGPQGKSEKTLDAEVQ